MASSGYINYTGVPVTAFDDERKLAYSEIDVDEGKQFIVSDIKIEGLDGGSTPRIENSRPGGVYNRRLWELSLSRISSLLPGCVCDPSQPPRFG